MKKILDKKICISVVGINIYFLLVHILECNLQSKSVAVMSIVAIFLIIPITIFLVINAYKKSKKINYTLVIISIIAIGILLRTLYITYTNINQRQHDVDGANGHLAYIQTIYETGRLPQSNEWQFYQQPLHHLLSSVWLTANKILGADTIKSQEGIQILTAIYSSMIMVISYCILKELKIKNVYKILVMMVIAVHPTFIILSGSINNDILMIMLTFLALLYLIKWNKKQSYKNTVVLALITALIALTKISGTIIAIPIIYVCINKFIEEYRKTNDKKKTILSYILKFLVFGVIALGLGLSYSIRNMILFKQPIFYVPTPGIELYCGNVSKVERFNIFNKELTSDIYCNPSEDCNIPAYIIKSSLFGEYNIKGTTYSNIVPITLVITNCILSFASIASLIASICQYNKLKRRFKVYLNIFVLLYISQIIMYIFANLSMPYGCTMDFRYIVSTIFIGMLFIVLSIMRFGNKKNNRLKLKTMYALATTFFVLSIIFEITQMHMLTI